MKKGRLGGRKKKKKKKIKKRVSLKTKSIMIHQI